MDLVGALNDFMMWKGIGDSTDTSDIKNIRGAVRWFILDPKTRRTSLFHIY